jgi:outer membrane protein OmpA-like peptidoglycan-associated protein
MKPYVAPVLAVILLLGQTLTVTSWVGGAKDRLAEEEAAPTAPIPVAAPADEPYCRPELKRILRRVLLSCGLAQGGAGERGCQPVQARTVATMSDSDFNALFLPIQQRASLVEFDHDSDQLDAVDHTLIDQAFADQRGASYFLVVSRASPEGNVDHNRDLSKRRAESVLAHLQQRFADPELERQVGLLWLGEEFAQLDPSFCAWHRSGPADTCDSQTINRSTFLAWIDCQL